MLQAEALLNPCTKGLEGLTGGQQSPGVRLKGQVVREGLGQMNGVMCLLKTNQN